MNASQPPPSTRVLVVDDLTAIHDDFRKVLAPRHSLSGLHASASALFGDAPPAATAVPFAVECAQQGQEALELVVAARAAGRPFAVAFVDMRMPPGWDGLETTRRLWNADPDLQVVICTAYSDHTWSETIAALGQSDRLIILKKPFESIEVLQLAHALSRKWSLTRAQRLALQSLDEQVRQRTAELSRAEERFSSAFAASPLAQVMVALDTHEIIAANAALADTFAIGATPGDDDHGGGSLFQRLEADGWRAMLERLRAGERIEQHPLVYRPRPSERREIRCSARRFAIGERDCALCVFTDITDRLRLEQQFLQSQKMEAIGQLAAGIAHDFNNLLTVILTYTGIVCEERDVPAGARANLGNVLNAGERAAALTRQLLLFSRRQLTKKERVKVTDTVGNLRKMLARVIPERIRVDLSLTAGDLPVLADEANLEHVVMNLVINARDAIPADGRISLTTSEVVIDDATATHPDARCGRYACITISDTGTGIAPETLPRIFEPFFTTKPVGHGTGLGLSTVYGIIREHGGWITVASAVGQGTTFSIYLPLSEAGAETAALDAAGADPAAARGGGERILIVEDDPAVRMVAVAVASRAGYHITSAEDGPSALARWQEAHGNFDLLVTDVVMPNGISGVELAQRLRAASPRLGVIYTTGYSAELLRGRATGSDTAAVVLKPYSAGVLLAAMRAALGAAPGTLKPAARPARPAPPKALAHSGG